MLEKIIETERIFALALKSAGGLVSNIGVKAMRARVQRLGSVTQGAAKGDIYPVIKRSFGNELQNCRKRCVQGRWN